MKLRALVLLLCAASVALVSAHPQSGGDETEALGRAKAAYENGVEGLTTALVNLVQQKKRALFPSPPTSKFDLVAANADALALENEIRLFESEGVWPASAVNDVQSLATSHALRAAMDSAYKAAFDAASTRGDAQTRQAYLVEAAAFTHLIDLGKWVALTDAPGAGDKAQNWTRTSAGWVSPDYKAHPALPTAFWMPLSSVPWHRQYKLRVFVESLDRGDGVHLAFPDARGHLVEYQVSNAALSFAQANRAFGKPGACLLVTVLDAATRIEAEGRTLSLIPSAGSGSGKPAPGTPLFEILPLGNARIRLESIGWKPLRSDDAGAFEPPAPVADDCEPRAPASLASVVELARAKVAYEEALRIYAQDLAAALRKPVQRFGSEDLQAVTDRMKAREEEATRFENDGVFPPSLQSSIADYSKALDIRKTLAVAYAKAGIEANAQGDVCARAQLATEFAAFRACTDYAVWRSLLPALVPEKGRSYDSSSLACPLEFAAEVPERYKIELLLSRTGDGGGCVIRATQPSSGPFEYHVTKADFEAHRGGEIFQRGGARLQIVVQPDYAAVELEGFVLWQRASENAAPRASTERTTWLVLVPDEATQLTVKGLKWKPLVEAPRVETEAVAKAPSAAPAAANPPPAKAGANTPVKLGLEWLKAHQSADGSWDCDGFTASCGNIKEGSKCDGAGDATHDVGVTGLALLAFLGGGSSAQAGPYSEQVAKAIHWLKEQQDPDLGIIGARTSHSFIYDHAIATQALCLALQDDPTLKDVAQKAVQFVSKARNPRAVWRYNYPPSGDNDTSVTGWCFFALAAGQSAGLEIDTTAFAAVKQWLEDMTDPATGQTGYAQKGTASARVTGMNDQFPVDKDESLTAIAVRIRSMLEKKTAKNVSLQKQIDRLMAHPPEWDESGFYNNVYYWYYGTHALAQVRGKPWEAWKNAVQNALTVSQVTAGDAKGSWNPKDAWGGAGGRVYMTAMALLCLEEAKRVR